MKDVSKGCPQHSFFTIVTTNGDASLNRSLPTRIAIADDIGDNGNPSLTEVMPNVTITWKRL